MRRVNVTFIHCYEAALGKSHLILDIADLFLDILLSPSSPRRERSTVEVMSAYLELHMLDAPRTRAE